MAISVKRRQSLIDLALQECGEMSGLMSLANANDMSVSEPVEADSLRNGTVVKSGVAEYYRQNSIRPATEITEAELEAMPCGGIGFMGIETDFIVS